MPVPAVVWVGPSGGRRRRQIKRIEERGSFGISRKGGRRDDDDDDDDVDVFTRADQKAAAAANESGWKDLRCLIARYP